MSLISEHRRRNVFKVASVYLITAWLLLQILSVVSPYLQLPIIVGKVAITIFIIGFPIVCFVAFIFEISPKGLRRLKNTSPTLIQKQKESNKPLSEAASKAIPTEPALQVSTEERRFEDIKKLAVLPFSNLIDDPESNFLGFALADQIIGSIAYSKHFLIRPSSLVRQYQHEVFDIKKVAEKLNVNYILTGNYLKQQEILRLNIELVELGTEEMLWREPFEIKYQNIFELQDIVSQKVASGLNVKFSAAERLRMKPHTPQNSVVYDLYLRAVAIPLTIEGDKQAIKLLNQSIKLDPLYAPSYFELGNRYMQMSQIGDDAKQAQHKSERAYLKALSIKEDFLPALANLGMIYTDSGKHQQAHQMLIKALKLNSNDSWLHFALSYHYRYIGFLEESKKELEISLTIDPKNPQFRSSIVTYMFLGEYQKILSSFNLALQSPFSLNYLGEVAFRHGDKVLAVEYFEKVLEIKDEISEYHFAAAFIEYINGNTDMAIALNLAREKGNPADSEIWYEIARLYSLFGSKDDCARCLKKSIEMGYVSYPSMQSDCFLDPIRNDPEIKAIIATAKIKYQTLKDSLVVDY